MDTIEQLLKQREEIDKKIEEQKKHGREEALKKVRDLCKLYGFSATELRSVLKTRKKREKSKASEGDTKVSGASSS